MRQSEIFIARSKEAGTVLTLVEGSHAVRTSRRSSKLRGRAPGRRHGRLRERAMRFWCSTV